MALIPYDDALGRVLERVPTMDPVEVPIADALGLVTAEDVSSEDPVPPFDNSAVDGFALRATDVVDVPTELEILETIAAGRAPTVTLQRGTCARIMTGAVIPPGADAVVMVEHTETHRVAADTDAAVAPADLDERPDDGGRDTVVILRSADVGQHIRPLGDDLRVGELAVARGTVIRAGHVGLLATVGRAAVRVIRRPVVGVMSTGDELVEGQAPLRAGQIRDSNRVMLLALCTQAGFDAVRPRPGRGRRVAHRVGPERRGGELRRGGDQRWGVDGRLRLREGRARKDRGDGVDAGRDQAGQTVRVRNHLRYTGVRTTRQPGVVAGQLRVARTSWTASHGRVLRSDPDAGTCCRRNRDGAAAATARRISCASGCPVAAPPWSRRRPGARGPTSSHHRPAADALAVLPDGEGVAQGALLEVIPLG